MSQLYSSQPSSLTACVHATSVSGDCRQRRDADSMRVMRFAFMTCAGCQAMTRVMAAVATS